MPGLKENVERRRSNMKQGLEDPSTWMLMSFPEVRHSGSCLRGHSTRNAPVIVLDEPTAALDPIAESDLYERYHELTKGSTSIYVSHRLASTKFCDRIILIGAGGIAEMGTHEELMDAGKEYAHLYEVQSRYYTEGGMEDAAFHA